MISVASPSRRLKKKEWNIYHNKGVQQDAQRFSLIDNVLDGELNEGLNGFISRNIIAKTGLLKRIVNKIKTIASHGVFRAYLLCWFSLYFVVSVAGKLIR